MVKIKVVSPVLLFSLAIALITILIVVVLQTKLPPQVPLFYGAAEGEAQLVPTWGLVIPSAFSLLVVVANTALLSFTKQEFIQKVLIFSAFVVTLFSTVTTIKIILLVGSL